MFKSKRERADVDDGQRVSPHQSPPILALGVLLFELQICGPIEGRYTADDLTGGIPNAYTQLTAAARVLEQLSADMDVGYAEAIDACLECDFCLDEEVTPSLDDENFRAQVYETIVLPLENELRIGWPDALKDLADDMCAMEMGRGP